MAELKYSGPYRATKLWNEMVYTFRNGMPLKRHRRHIKVYEDCFSGVEAVRWFHAALQRNPSIGPEISKDQVTQLLNKFLKAGIFETVSSSSSNGIHQFKDNGDLYQFCRRPLSTCVMRAPLASTSTNIPQRNWFNEQRPPDSKVAMERNCPPQWKLNTKDRRGSNDLGYQGPVNNTTNSGNCIAYPQRQISVPNNPIFNDRENIPPTCTQIKFPKSNPYVSAQRKPPNPYEEQIPKRYGEIQKQHLSAINMEPDFSHNHILHKRNEANLKYLHPTWHDSERPYHSSQYGNINGTITRKPSISAQHEHFGTSQHGNLHIRSYSTLSPSSQHINRSHSARNDEAPSISSNLSRSLSNSLQNADGFSAHNRLGIPNLSNSLHDDNKLQKYHQMPFHSLPRKIVVSPNHCQISQLKDHDTHRNLSFGLSQNINITSENSSSCNQRKDEPMCERNMNTKFGNWSELHQLPVVESCLPPSTFPVTSGQVHSKGMIWRNMVLSRLQALLDGMEGLSSLLPTNLPEEWLRANIGQDELPRYQLPKQYLTIIKYLQYCHEEYSAEAASAIKDYFCKLSEPLTTFELYNVLTQAFLYIEFANNSHSSRVQRFENIPSQSTENLVLGMASPQPKIEKCVKTSHITDCNNLINGSKLQSTILPPNSCFETAFTSDSPVTRIVPQRTIDSLHISRKNVTAVHDNEVQAVKLGHRIVQRNPSFISSGHNSLSKVYDPAGLSGRNSSAPNLTDLHSENKPTTYRNVKAVEKSDSRTCKKRVHGKGKRIGWQTWRNSQDLCNRNSGESQLQHCRNKSGGYVNPALSQSLDDEVDSDLSHQELDYVAALETLQRLVQYSRNTSGHSLGENITVDSGSECSGSDSGSYYTAASSSRESSCRDSQVFSDSLESTISDIDQWTPEGMSLGVAVLQLLLLLIPPANRVQLRHLLHFLRQMTSLRTGCFQSVWDMTKVRACFAPSVLRSRRVEDYDAPLVNRMVNFLITHEDAIMQVPSDLQSKVRQEIKERSQFKESYPEIYQRRFPESKPVEKRRGFLHLPSLARFRSLRV